VALGDVFEFAVRGRWADQRIINVFHYRAIASAGSEHTDLVTAWEASVKTPYLNVMSTEYTLEDYAIRKPNDPEFAQAIISASSPVAGARTGTVGVPGGAAVITWTTGLAGRSRRGRTYIGPLSETDTNQGTFTAGFTSVLTTFANAARATLIVDDIDRFQRVVWSRTLSSYANVTGHVVRSYIRSQRRRNIGIGR